MNILTTEEVEDYDDGVMCKMLMKQMNMIRKKMMSIIMKMMIIKIIMKMKKITLKSFIRSNEISRDSYWRPPGCRIPDDMKSSRGGTVITTVLSTS